MTSVELEKLMKNLKVILEKILIFLMGNFMVESEHLKLFNLMNIISAWKRVDFNNPTLQIKELLKLCVDVIVGLVEMPTDQFYVEVTIIQTV